MDSRRTPSGVAPLRVGVVGCGPAGATAAALLSDLDHEVTLLEQAPVLRPVGAGLLLQPSGQLVLEQLGMMSEIAAVSAPIESVEASTPRGRPLLRLRYDEVGAGVRAYGVQRAALFDTLARAVAARPIELVLGAEIAERQGSWLHTAAGKRYGPFDLVIAADGSQSRLRDDASLTRWRHEYAYGALWAVGHSTTVTDRLHQVVRGTRDLVGLLPLGSGRCNLFWSQRLDRVDELRARGFDTWRADVIHLCPEAEEVLTGFTAFDELTIATYRHVISRSGATEGMVLLGDAWHPMSPHLGQGVNLALIDAYLLAHYMATSDTVEQAAAALALARRGPLRWYGLVTMALSPFFQSDGHLKGALRDIGLPLMIQVPPLRRRMTRTMSGLDLGLWGGRLKLPTQKAKF